MALALSPVGLLKRSSPGRFLAGALTGPVIRDRRMPVKREGFAVRSAGSQDQSDEQPRRGEVIGLRPTPLAPNVVRLELRLTRPSILPRAALQKDDVERTSRASDREDDLA